MSKKTGSLGKRVAELIDREGVVLRKQSTPFMASLEMELEKNGLRARLWATQSPYSNGSTNVKVHRGRLLVFESNGDMWLNMKDEKNADDKWEGELFRETP